MTAPKCRCWRPYDHEKDCPLRRAQEQERKVAERLLASIRRPRVSDCG